MLRRLLPAVLLIIVACAVALALALTGADPQPSGSAGGGALSAAEATLQRTGDGPAGSAVVTLTSWRYRADPDNRGRDRGWGKGRFGGRTVQVPYSPNAGAFRDGAGTRAYDGAVGWFAKDFDAPLAGLYAVRFESVQYKATVFVDGKAVREHVGAYEPFTARVPLQRGRHTIAVRADWRGPRRL